MTRLRKPGDVLNGIGKAEVACEPRSGACLGTPLFSRRGLYQQQSNH